MPTASNGNLESLKQFTMDLSHFEQVIMPSAHSAFVRKIAFEVLRGVILKTPVDTGLLRGNWLVSIGQRDFTQLPPEEAIVDTSITMANGLFVIAKANISKQIIYIQNNLPYAEAIEDGHSTVKAPQGMLLLTLEEIKDQFGV